jgi:hypothetical protein
MTAFSETCERVIAIDGKVLRRSFDKASKKSALHMVNAWGWELGMVLAQIATDANPTRSPRLEDRRSSGFVAGADGENGYRVIEVVTRPMPENAVSIRSPGMIGNWRVNDPVITISPAFKVRP